MATRFPFPTVPRGWFQVGVSSDLRPGDLRPVRYLGRDLVLCRFRNGEAAVFDAHCPHLGAHLGYGGCVREDGLVCPFHGWTFDATGANVAIPYSDRLNRRATIGVVPVREVNGLVLAWYDPAGAPPAWEIPSLPEVDDDGFLRIHGERLTIRSHVQDILENTVDIAHFMFVHGTAGFGAVDLLVDGPRLRATAEVTFVTPKGHVDGHVVSELWGPGIDVVRPKGILDAAVIFSVTPVEDEQVEVGYTFVVPRGEGGGPTSLARGLLADFEKQVRQDVPIWEHKRYEASPALAIGDGPILEYRRWVAQFYAP